MTTDQRRQEQEFAKDAMAVQDACNMTAVVNTFAKHLSNMCAFKTSYDLERHPATILFVSKIQSLTPMNNGMAFSIAWAAATDLAK